MKILHITEKPRFSGAEILIKDLSLSHIKNHSVAIASINPTENDFHETMQYLEKVGVKLYIPSKALSKIKRFTYLYNVLSQYKPDIVVGHSSIVSAYLRIVGIFFPKIQKIIVLHAAAADYESGGRLQKAEYGLQYFTNYVIGVSDWSTNIYRKRFGYPKSKAIYNGVDFTKFTKDNLQYRDTIRASIFKVTENDFVVLQVGRVNPVKNQMLTLQSVVNSNIKNKNNIKIIFAGIIEDKEYYKSLIKFSEEYGLSHQITFLGARSDIPKLLYASNLYVMPSERENFSIAILEALSIGIPVIYSNITQFEFLNKYNYKNTYKVDLEDINSFTIAVEDVIKNKKDFIDRNLEDFSFEKCSKEYMDLFKETQK